MRSVLRSVLILLALSAGSATLGSAQTSRGSTLAPGTRIRLKLRTGERREARVVALETDSLRTQSGQDGFAITLPLVAIETLEIEDGVHTRMARSGAIGAAAGITAGAAIGIASYDGPMIGYRNRGELALAYGAAGGAAGLVIGGALGLIPQQRWKNLPVTGNAVRVNVRPLPRSGAGVALALAF